jgi:hypothetical protein
MASSDSVKSFDEPLTLKMPTLAQTEGCSAVLCKLFGAMHSEGKPMTGLVKIQKATFYYKTKITTNGHSLRAITKITCKSSGQYSV